MEAMGGKYPLFFIIDGDLSMRNEIKKVFPNAHRRLCAWNLLRNTTSNIKNSKFVSKFKQCMLGDFYVDEFESRWNVMSNEFQLQHNSWIRELYEKRRMWATTHIRGEFFAGFLTTSRCEGLHSKFGKHVSILSNLFDFCNNSFGG